MPDDPAFIRMIAAAPDDDAPRLVYADVLEERGDPAGVARAEFIRVQCEKARLVPDTPRSRELWFREAALFDWARAWRAELPAVRGLQYGGFRRGFIDDVYVHDAEAFFRSAGLVFDRLPLRRLEIRDHLADALRERLSAVEGMAYVQVFRSWPPRLLE